MTTPDPAPETVPARTAPAQTAPARPADRRRGLKLRRSALLLALGVIAGGAALGWPELAGRLLGLGPVDHHARAERIAGDVQLGLTRAAFLMDAARTDIALGKRHALPEGMPDDDHDDFLDHLGDRQRHEPTLFDNVLDRPIPNALGNGPGWKPYPVFPFRAATGDLYVYFYDLDGDDRLDLPTFDPADPHAAVRRFHAGLSRAIRPDAEAFAHRLASTPALSPGVGPTLTGREPDARVDHTRERDQPANDSGSARFREAFAGAFAETADGVTPASDALLYEHHAGPGFAGEPVLLYFAPTGEATFGDWRRRIDPRASPRRQPPPWLAMRD
jgi:hypothetical protein